MRKLLLSYFLFLISYFSFSQQFGGNPPSLKWKQINTDSARIIFPVGLDSQAQRVASVIHYLAAHKPIPLGNELHKINVVLQNQTTIANGYVQLGPFRSEFFLTPMFNNFEEGSLPWADQLAVHEYRHVMQFNNFHNGLSKLAYTLFGQDGLDLAINASIPNWFYEGDAVYNETILTNQGRGRLPLFMNSYPSLWYAKKNYSWMKLRNESLKDYVPNHYYLGYMLVNYGREKYGTDFWTKVTHDASAFKGFFYPFQKAIKKYAGVDYKTFYEQAFEYYKQLTPALSANEKEMQSSAIKNISPLNEKSVTNYDFPYYAGDDSLLYVKSSYRRRPAFYIKDSIGEHKLRVKDISIDDQFSYRNGKIVYSAYETDARWGWKDFGVIKLLDVKSGHEQTITHKTKYFTPDISPDGTKIAAVLLATNGKCELHILDAASGQVLKVIRSSEVSLYTDPKFVNDNSLITAVRLLNGKMALATVDVQIGSTVRLTPPSFSVVGYPCINNGIIYFTASFLGNDDVYAMELSNFKMYKVTNGPFGNYFVNVSNGKVIWSTFTADGYKLEQMPVQINDSSDNEKYTGWKEMNMDSLEQLIPPYAVSHSDEFKDILQHKVPARNFPVSKYNKATKLLNFHSWRPYYQNPEFTFSLYGENVLNTLQTELYYLYNQNDKTNAVGFTGIYGAWFPYLDLGTQYTFDQQQIIGNRVRQWGQLDSKIGLSIPLNITKGRMFSSFTAGTDYVWRNEFNKGFYKDSLGTVNFSYLSHYISWSQQLQQMPQNIYPRFGYAVSLSDLHAITKYTGYQFLAGASLYLPGLFVTHSLVLSGAFQQRDTLNQLVFSNLFSYSRGYNEIYFSRMWRLSANYHFPIIYPDWGFADILYIQRIRGNGFYDFTKVYSRNKLQTADLRSVGAEIYFDTKWWNQYPLTFGFRISRLLDYDLSTGIKGTVFEFILPVTIIPK